MSSYARVDVDPTGRDEMGSGEKGRRTERLRLWCQFMHVGVYILPRLHGGCVQPLLCGNEERHDHLTLNLPTEPD
jgi:hypothetical protein